MKKLLWEIDLMIYRLFYWRWSPRLKGDPNLAYMFAEFGKAWVAQNPPRHTYAVDQLLEAERERIRQGRVCLDRSH